MQIPRPAVIGLRGAHSSLLLAVLSPEQVHCSEVSSSPYAASDEERVVVHSRSIDLAERRYNEATSLSSSSTGPDPSASVDLGSAELEKMPTTNIMLFEISAKQEQQLGAILDAGKPGRGLVR